MDQDELDARAIALCHTLAKDCNSLQGSGSFSSTVYDSVWVATVFKTVGRETQWRFPQCFQYVLDYQLPDGGWEAYATQVDGILNTMAALLALKMHADRPTYLQSSLPEDIDKRISDGCASLQRQFDEWNVEETVSVGFELLVPALLHLLEESGLSFTIPEHEALTQLTQEKLAKFKPEILYGPQPNTLVHSLEAFIGHIDFDRVRHQKVNGSMMGSPSATAAYLMRSSDWDYEAEEYLAVVLASTEGGGFGGVPSAFPTTVFMASWALSTLLTCGFTAESLGIESVHMVAEFLQSHLDERRGLIGFAPKFMEDADDTAKTILTLTLLGRTTTPDPMVSQFESENHFKTYSAERNPSFSANCNVLTTLLFAPQANQYQAQIFKAVKFLCDLWDSGRAGDKWNVSPLYSYMLLSHALQNSSGYGFGRSVGSDSLRGTGTDSSVVTTMVECPQTRDEGPGQKESDDDYGTNALSKEGISWVEKVTYSSPILRETYCLAAIKARFLTQVWGSNVLSIADAQVPGFERFVQFFSRLPLLAGEPDWRLHISLIEGSFFVRQLRRVRLDIFPRKDMEEDKYLIYIPLIWTVCNNHQAIPLSTNFLWDMMVISMLNFQVDEYMEAVIGGKLANHLEPIKDIIRSLCDTSISSLNGNGHLNGSAGGAVLGPSLNNKRKRSFSQANGETEPKNSAQKSPSMDFEVKEALADASRILGRFVDHVMCHGLVRKASTDNRRLLKSELETYMLAHIAQIEDNQRFSTEPTTPTSITQYTRATGSYFSWVRTTSADHTSCPYSFAFVTCLMDATPRKGSGCFVGAKQNYLAQALCRHLATMCRQYNDLGSLARDHAERNLNSANFPEFHAETSGRGTRPSATVTSNGTAKGVSTGKTVENGEGARGQAGVEAAIKADLLEIAEYERECLMVTKRKLDQIVPARISQTLSLFVDVTDLHGQIYLARDIASRMR